jgi:hypothetical protein
LAQSGSCTALEYMNILCEKKFQIEGGSGPCVSYAFEVRPFITIHSEPSEGNCRWFYCRIIFSSQDLVVQSQLQSPFPQIIPETVVPESQQAAHWYNFTDRGPLPLCYTDTDSRGFHFHRRTDLSIIPPPMRRVYEYEHDFNMKIPNESWK